MAILNKKQQIQNADDYFSSLPDEQRKPLEKLRQLIKTAAPDAEEGLTYQNASIPA